MAKSSAISMPWSHAATHQVIEIRQRPESWFDGIMSALFIADRIGAAGIVGAGFKAIVRAFAVRSADRMDRQGDTGHRTPSLG